MIVLIGEVSAQTESPLSSVAIELARRVENITASKSLDVENKTRVLEEYSRASNVLDRALEWELKSSQFEEGINETPALQIIVEDELVSFSELPELITGEESINILEQRRSQARADLTRLRTESAEVLAEPARRSERRRAIPELVSAAKSKIQEHQIHLLAASSSGELAELISAREFGLNLRIRNRENELTAYEKELQYYDARTQLISQRMALSSRKVTRQEAQLDALNSLANLRRQQEAERIAFEARELTKHLTGYKKEVSDHFMEMIEENNLLNERITGRDGLLYRLQSLELERSEMSKLLENLRSNLARTRERVSASGSSVVVGLLLRQQSEKLPKVRTHISNVRQRQSIIAKAEIERIDIREDWLELLDIELAVKNEIEEMPIPASEAKIGEAEDVLRSIFEARYKTLDTLLTTYDSYFTKLIDIDAQENQLITLTTEYSDFIAERVLFIRSDNFPTLKTLQDGKDGIIHLLNPDSWIEMTLILVNNAKKIPWVVY